MSSSRVETKQYHETRTSSSKKYHPNGTAFDNNLDHLLDDLQNTVQRPLTNGTNHYKESKVEKYSSSSSGKENILDKPHYYTTTPVTDYTVNDSYSYTGPDGSKHFRNVKSESYQYRSDGQTDPPEKLRSQSNINQLDSLLDDLQQVKRTGISQNSMMDRSELKEYRSSSRGRTTPSYNDRSRSLDRSEVSYQHNEGTYGDIKSIRARTPSPTITKKITNVQTFPPTVVDASRSDIHPEILANLDPELLPNNNTKVTTTIKTYTYEIPGDGSDPVYVPLGANESITTPSKSFVYSSNKYLENSSSSANSTMTRGGGTYSPTSPKSDRKLVRETVTTKNYHPDNKVYKDTQGKRTYIYNENTMTRNYNEQRGGDHSRPHSRPQTPTNTDLYQQQQYEQHHQRSSSRTDRRDDSPDRTSLPPVTSTIHKFDSLTNLNARHYPEAVETFDPRHGPPVVDQQPEVNITYKYSSTSNTTNKYNTERYDNEPIMPRKFPTDETEGPPKKVDELMATLGHAPPTNAYNVGWSAHEREIEEQRKVEALKSHQEYERKKQEIAQPARNVPGPAVYYPPGEMFQSKESAAYRAEGAMAKEKAKYQYEAASKSKSKSKTGAAIVPVCLPLCCGVPCTII